MKNLLLLLATVSVLHADGTASSSILKPLFALDPSERDAEIPRLVSKCKETSNGQLIEAVNQELRKSINDDYSVDRRDSITQFASKLGDPSSLPILVEHLSFWNPGPITGGMGFSTFRAEHPYAAALARFSSDPLPIILNAVANNKGAAFSDFDRVAETTVLFMSKQNVYAIIDRYAATSNDSKLCDFITACVAIMAPGSEGIQYVQYRIDATKESDKLTKLRKLASDLADPKTRAAISPGGKWWGSFP